MRGPRQLCKKLSSTGLDSRRADKRKFFDVLLYCWQKPRSTKSNVCQGLHGHCAYDAATVAGIAEQDVHDRQLFALRQRQPGEHWRDMPSDFLLLNLREFLQ